MNHKLVKDHNKNRLSKSIIYPAIGQSEAYHQSNINLYNSENGVIQSD